MAAANKDILKQQELIKSAKTTPPSSMKTHLPVNTHKQLEGTSLIKCWMPVISLKRKKTLTAKSWQFIVYTYTVMTQ